MSKNPTNKTAVTGKVSENGSGFHQMLQPANQIELTNNAPITTAATSSSPFGFATGDQLDDLLTSHNEIRAGLIALGLFKDAVSNAD